MEIAIEPPWIKVSIQFWPRLGRNRNKKDLFQAYSIEEIASSCRELSSSRRCLMKTIFACVHVFSSYAKIPFCFKFIRSFSLFILERARNFSMAFIRNFIHMYYSKRWMKWHTDTASTYALVSQIVWRSTKKFAIWID